MNNQQQYHAWLFEHIDTIKQDKVTLVKNRQTGELAVKKYVAVELFPVYEVLRTIQHKNIPIIYDVFEEGNEQGYIVQEYINGKTLQTMLDGGNTFTEKEALGYATQLCDALTTLHELSPAIIHRDIKPSNVMLSADGIIKLIDFDAARVHKPEAQGDTVHIGTHGYAAPEQYGFGQTDARSDIYALGMLLKVLVAGSYSPAFHRLVEKCTAINAKDRYASASALKTAIKQIAHQKQVWLGVGAIAVCIMIFTVSLWPKATSWAASREQPPSPTPISHPDPEPTPSPIATAHALTIPTLQEYVEDPTRNLFDHPYIRTQIREIMTLDDYSYFISIFQGVPTVGSYFTADDNQAVALLQPLSRDTYANANWDEPAYLAPEDSSGALVFAQDGSMYIAFLRYDEEREKYMTYYFTNVLADTTILRYHYLMKEFVCAWDKFDVPIRFGNVLGVMDRSVDFSGTYEFDATVVAPEEGIQELIISPLTNGEWQVINSVKFAGEEEQRFKFVGKASGSTLEVMIPKELAAYGKWVLNFCGDDITALYQTIGDSRDSYDCGVFRRKVLRSD